METTIEYKGKTIEVKQDLTPMNPRIENCNLGTMICSHRRYNLGDEHSYTDEGIRDILTDKNNVIVPLYLYDHSGITMSTKPFSCNWDSGQVGFIYVSKQKIREEYGVKRVSAKLLSRILLYLDGEVEIYDNYLTGEVYGYDIENTDESCWGFYGSDHRTNGLLEYAENAIDCFLSNENI